MLLSRAKFQADTLRLDLILLLLLNNKWLFPQVCLAYLPWFFTLTTPTEPTKEVSTERVSSTFSRVFWLPRPVNAEGVKAKMKHGVLTLEIPKDLEKSSVVVPVQ